MSEVKINKLGKLIEIFDEMSRDLKLGRLSSAETDVLLSISKKYSTINSKNINIKDMERKLACDSKESTLNYRRADSVSFHSFGQAGILASRQRQHQQPRRRPAAPRRRSQASYARHLLQRGRAVACGGGPNARRGAPRR